jgi:hypothetical protein
MTVPVEESPDETGSIVDIKVVEYIKHIYVEWKQLKELSDVEVHFSKAAGGDQTTILPVRKDDGGFDVELKNLTPYTAYNFNIVGTDPAGGIVSYSGYATTRGYPVRVTVKKNNQIVPAATVSVGGYTYVTNSDGWREFELPSGDVEFAASKGTATTKQTIAVKEATLMDSDTKAEMQYYDLSLESSTSLSALGAPIGLIFILLILGLAGFMVWRKKHQEKAAQWRPLTGVYDVEGVIAGSSGQAEQSAYIQPSPPQSNYYPAPESLPDLTPPSTYNVPLFNYEDPLPPATPQNPSEIYHRK